MGIKNLGTFINCTFTAGFVPVKMCSDRVEIPPVAFCAFEAMTSPLTGTNKAARLLHALTTLRKRCANIFWKKDKGRFKHSFIEQIWNSHFYFRWTDSSHDDDFHDLSKKNILVRRSLIGMLGDRWQLPPYFRVSSLNEIWRSPFSFFLEFTTENIDSLSLCFGCIFHSRQ